MEPQVEIYCKKDKKKNCSCISLILAILLITLSFFVGALIAALTGFVVILGIGAVAVLIIALALLTIISIIALICCKNANRKKCNC
ncbi:MAG: hypothetical protein HFJ55_03345 [Clostridia bacterium]|nr:hypothetical protein [Clostridia bacterium]